MKKPRPRQPKMALDMEFEEALRRFVQTSPDELEDNVEKSKKKKPSRAKKKAREAQLNVVSLRDVRRRREP